MWGPLRALFGFSVATNLLLLAAPIHMLQVYDRVLTSRSAETLIYITLIAVLALCAYGVAEAIRGILAQRLSNRFSLDYSDNIFGYLVQDRRGDEDASKIFRDLGTIRQFLASRQFVSLFDLPFAPLFLALMFLLHFTLGLFALAGIVFMVAVALLNNKMTQEARGASNKAKNEATAFSSTVMRRIEDIRAMGLLPAIKTRWGVKTASSLNDADTATSFTSMFYGFSRLIRQSLQVLTMAWGAYLVLQGDMSGGMIFAGTMLLGKALMPVEQLIGNWEGICSARASYDSIIALARRVEDKPDLTTLPEPTGQVKVENLTYNPDATGSRNPILDAVSFELEPGSITVAIGPSGAGKSTLARLLVGAIAPTSGAIRLDGFDLEQWPEDQRGRAFGYVPQDIVLFPGTVAENIARLDVQPEDAKIVEAAELAGVHSMVAGLPDGYGTVIGPGAVPLSGGQRQRIALARAYYTSPSVLILDEPNAHLDEQGEKLLMSSLGTARKAGMTIFVVSQRKSILQIADRVMVVEDGSVKQMQKRKMKSKTPQRLTAEKIRPPAEPEGKQVPVPLPATPPAGHPQDPLPLPASAITAAPQHPAQPPMMAAQAPAPHPVPTAHAAPATPAMQQGTVPVQPAPAAIPATAPVMPAPQVPVSNMEQITTENLRRLRGLIETNHPQPQPAEAVQ